MTQYIAVRNRFQPTHLVPKPYGWTGAPSYNRSDVPTALVDRPAFAYTAEEMLQSFAYEWLESGTLPDSGYANPPFTTGAAGRLNPALRDHAYHSGHPGARILRGFIRRANWEAGDPVSKARLYFMYNPEQITREYVSYLDQAALDPFNTVYQSGNLVAPPSFMNFRFDLLFDRQTEAQEVHHPGVFVDYQFFDLVVRNVIPTDPNETSNQLPDNGVMMVNPRDITVVFSPQLTVQGRPINAQVVFEKFTHRMTPIRMRISLEMRVMYFGPMLEQSEYRMQQAEFASEVTVPFEEEFNFNITYQDLVINEVPGAAVGAAIGDYLDSANGQADTANARVRQNALAYAMSHVNANAFYSQDGSHRMNLPHSADCSGLVYSSYKGIGQHTAVFSGNSNVESMMDHFTSTSWRTAKKVASWQTSMPNTHPDFNQVLFPGDLLYKWDNGPAGDHVAFFINMEGGKAAVFDAAGKSANPQVGKRTKTLAAVGREFNHIVRPSPIAQDSVTGLTNNPHIA